jgi:hypothetical protein
MRRSLLPHARQQQKESLRHGHGNNRKSLNLGVFYTRFWGLSKIIILGGVGWPAGPKTIPKGEGLRPPLFGMVFGAAGAAQTPKIDDVRPAQKPCIENPPVVSAGNIITTPPIPGPSGAAAATSAKSRIGVSGDRFEPYRWSATRVGSVSVDLWVSKAVLHMLPDVTQWWFPA